jgi:hypothetical protein
MCGRKESLARERKMSPQGGRRMLKTKRKDTTAYCVGEGVIQFRSTVFNDAK